jgi:hypothetical protein
MESFQNAGSLAAPAWVELLMMLKKIVSLHVTGMGQVSGGFL